MIHLRETQSTGGRHESAKRNTERDEETPLYGPVMCFDTVSVPSQHHRAGVFAVGQPCVTTMVSKHRTCKSCQEKSDLNNDR
jgi:hypothetical protein